MDNEIRKDFFVMVVEDYVDTAALPVPVKRYLIGHEYNVAVRLSEDRYLKASENEDYEYIHSHRISNRNEIAEQMAVKHAVSAATISKYGAFARILEEIYLRNVSIAKSVLDEKTHLSQKDLKSLSKSLQEGSDK